MISNTVGFQLGSFPSKDNRRRDTANHIRHFDLTGLNPEGTSQIDVKEFTVSHAVGNPLQEQRQTKHIHGSLTCRLYCSLALRSAATFKVFKN